MGWFLVIVILTIIGTTEPPKHTNAQANLNNLEAKTAQVALPSVESVSDEPQIVQKTVETPPPEPVPMSNREIGQQMAAEKGWTGDQWLCLEQLWTNESNWNHTVANYEGSGAYGIAQSLPADKMASHGADYLSNPRTQIAWGLDYISNRYGTPCGALNFWNNQYPHWY